MNINETTQALALAQAFDNRTVGEVNIRAWHAVLGDLEAADVMTAIKDHYSGATEWIMPAHIRARVGVMAQQRAAAAHATGWAPGQAGVPKDQAMPIELRPGGPYELLRDVDVDDADVGELLAALRAKLPEGSREALMPRREHWEREHRAFVRTRDAEPNPLYRAQPTYPGKPCAETVSHGRHLWNETGIPTGNPLVLHSQWWQCEG